MADKQELERGSPGQGVVGRIGGGGGAVDDAVIVEVDDILAEPGGNLDILERVHQDAALRRGILLADDALELGGDVLHHDLIQRNAGIKLGRSCSESIVGVAAAAAEVVGDDRIGVIGLELLAVDAVDDHAVDALGTIVGGSRIGLGIGVIGDRRGDGVVDAGNLREAADRIGRAVGGGFKRLEQLSAGNVDRNDRVAEGQDLIDVLLGHIAGVDGLTDTAAVGDGDHMVRVNRQGFLILQDLPDHRIGEQVAVVGLAVAVAVGGLRAVEHYFALGKDRAVLLVDTVNDLLRGGSHGRVLGSVFLDLEEGVALDLLGGVVDDDHADIGECGTGGLDGLAVLALGHHSVGVTVDDEVDALDGSIQIGGAVGLGLTVNTKVRKADDNVRILERLDLIGGGLGEGIIRRKGQALDLGGVGFGLGLRRLHAEEADLHTGLGGVGVVRIEDGGTVLIEDVRADDLELGLAHVFLELGIAVVELVVAEGDDVVARGIHHRDRISALGGADIGRALAVVAGVDEDDLGALGLIVGLELCDVGIALDRTVHVIRMQNDSLARHLGFRISGGVRRKAGHSQAENHRHCEQDG